MRRTVFLAIVALAAAVVYPRAFAQTYTWNGVGMMGSSMNLNTNWVGNVTPVSGSPNLKLVFNGGNQFPQQDINTLFSVQDLQFGAFFNPSGNAFKLENLGANPTISVANNGVQMGNAINFDDPTTLTGTNGSLSFSGALTGSNLTFNGIGNASFSIQGVGTSLGGINTVNPNATLNINQPAAMGGTLNVAGGIVNLGATNAIASSTNVNISAGGQVVLNASNAVNNLDISGGSVLNGATLAINGGLSSSSGASAISNSGGAVILGGPTSINVTSTGTDNLNVQSQITSGTFNKTGGGRLILSSFIGNSFSGVNTVSAGVLQGQADAIGNVVNNATVELTGGVLNTNQITGSGNVVIMGFAQYNVAQGYGGTTTISGGSLGGTVATLPALITGVTNGSVDFQDAGNTTYAGTLAGPLFVIHSGVGVLTLGGNNTYTLGTASFNGGLAIASDTAIGSGGLFVAGSATLEAVGSRTLANQFDPSQGLTFQGGGSFNFTDATAKTLTGTITHNSTGSTSIAGKFTVSAGSSLVVNSGILALGDQSLVNGFTSAGPVVVNGGTLTLRSLNFITLPTVTLAGGTLNVPNGYAIPLSAVLQGQGAVTGRIATANGSTIIASGNLALGDAASSAGVNLDGELYTNNNTVTLNDSNQAVLGSLTQLGDGVNNGTLAAPNGLVLNFGRNLVGRGTVSSNNTLADAVIINGDVSGDTPSNYIDFTGYVKGVGTFNNVAFSGTFSPGLSPTLSTVGNVTLTPSNVLDMELGGLARGGQYDAFDITGVMQLAGQMKVTLLNAFNPSLGDQFNLFDGSMSGAFSSFAFPNLAAGLVWNTSQLYTDGILKVSAVPEPATLLPMALALAAAYYSKRRR